LCLRAAAWGLQLLQLQEERDVGATNKASRQHRQQLGLASESTHAL